MELRQADEHQRQERLAVALEVGEQVEMSERGVGHQVGLVEDDHGVRSVLARGVGALPLDRLEHRGGRGLGLQMEGVAVSLPRFRRHPNPAYMRIGDYDDEAQETLFYRRIQG